MGANRKWQNTLRRSTMGVALIATPTGVVERDIRVRPKSRRRVAIRGAPAAGLALAIANAVRASPPPS